MKNCVIVSAVRTAIGSFNGSLASTSAIDLGATVIKAAIERAKIDSQHVDEVIMGNVLQAGLGQNPARQALLKSGLAETVCGFTVNKVCGSGLKSVALAAQAIQAGQAQSIVAGGMENMSLAPYLLDAKARSGYRLGDGQVYDVILRDGLMCATHGYHMGITAENVAKEYGITREMQDELALSSQAKAAAAQDAGRFADEIVGVQLPQKKGDPLLFNADEYLNRKTNAEALSGLRPAFDKAGSVTAGNASGINDGAAAVVVMSASKAKALGLTPLATIKAYATSGLDPATMGMGPVFAVRKALGRIGWQVGDVDLFELNEAFAAQACAVNKVLGVDAAKVNVNGGAIAIGHPIGASGCRVLVTLLHEMQRRDAKKGLAALCIGGGMGVALAVERS